MNAHPAHYFIKYLLVSQEDISVDSVNSTLNLHGMAPVDPAYLMNIRAEVGELPEDFRPWDRTDRASNRWLRQQKIFSLVHPDEATFEMRESVLSNPQLRRKIEGLTLGNVSHREATYRLQKAGHPISELALAEYRHYFWNPDIMGISDWAAYFALDEGEHGTGRTTAMAPLYNVVLQAGPELALYRMGTKRELDRRKIMGELQEELYYTFLETRTLPLSAKKVEMLTNLARSLVRVDEQMRTSESALHDVLKRFERFKVLSDQATVPKLIDLAPTGSVSQKTRAEILMSKESRDE
jgi:hypothetical protein